jgi:hypothetical protein
MDLPHLLCSMVAISNKHMASFHHTTYVLRIKGREISDLNRVTSLAMPATTVQKSQYYTGSTFFCHSLLVLFLVCQILVP